MIQKKIDNLKDWLTPRRRKIISKIIMLLIFSLTFILALTYLLISTNAFNFNKDTDAIWIENFNKAWIGIQSFIVAFSVPMFYAKIILILKNFAKSSRQSKIERENMNLLKKQQYKKIAKQIENNKNIDENKKIFSKDQKEILILKNFLSRFGITSLSSNDIAEIFKLLKKSKPDLANICDFIFKKTGVKLIENNLLALEVDSPNFFKK